MDRKIAEAQMAYTKHLKLVYPSHTGCIRKLSREYWEDVVQGITKHNLVLDDLMSLVVASGRGLPDPSRILAKIPIANRQYANIVAQMVNDIEVNIRSLWSIVKTCDKSLEEVLSDNNNDLPDTFRYAVGSLLNINTVKDKYNHCSRQFNSRFYHEAFSKVSRQGI